MSASDVGAGAGGSAAKRGTAETAITASIAEKRLNILVDSIDEVLSVKCKKILEINAKSIREARRGGMSKPQALGVMAKQSSGVRSTEEMDIAINDLNSKFASMSTVLEEIRSAIVGGGNHPNREGDERGIHRSRTNFKGFNDNHERNQPLKQVWRHDDMMSSDEDEGEETMDEYNRGPMRGDRRRTMVGQNVNPRGYGERQSYRVKAEIPNFVGNLDIEAVLDWLYEVDKFFDIMEVPEEEQVKVVAYKLRGGAGAWWQREQDNRRAQGRRPVDTWMRMKRMIKGRFLPPDIEQILYQQYHTCVQGKRTIADYTGEFLRLQARCNLRETDEQSAARRSNMESSSNYGSRPNPIQSTIPSTTTTTLSSKASGSGGDKNKESQPVNSNPYARLTGAKCFRAYRLEEDQRHEERIRRYDELKNLLLSLIQKSSSPVQSSRPVTTKVPAVTTTVHAKSIQNSPLPDDLTSDPNKKTTEKGVRKEGFGCALNMSKGSHLGLRHCATNRKRKKRSPICVDEIKVSCCD
ncbi:transposon ty3-I gag-pol polyprotein [Tanacetum coccineum]